MERKYFSKVFTLILLCSMMFINVRAQTTIEAENYTSLVNGTTPIVKENSGASIGYFDEAGEKLNYSVTIATSGYYEIRLRYLSGVTGKVECITNQNASGFLNFDASGAGEWWLTPIANWTSTSYSVSPLFYFASGTQTFSIRNTGAAVNLDKIELLLSSNTNTTINSILVNPAKIELMPNKSVQITAYGVNSDNKTIAAPITWSANAPNGLFTAGASLGVETVTVQIGGILKTIPVKIANPSKKRDYVVTQFGKLTVKESTPGANDWAVRGENGSKASLTGPSFFWSGSAETWWTKETVDWLVDDWHIQLIRCPASIAPGYYENSAGYGYYTPVTVGTTWNANDYYHNPDLVKKMMDEMVIAAIENDIYIIIDFHEHHAQFWKQQALEFFDYFSKKWGAYPNVLYEIFNEPFVNDQVNQGSYADDVCQKIRANDPDNIIIIGSKNWSRDPDYGASFYRHGNIAGTWHGYVENNHQADWASNSHWNNGTGVVVTEWGRDATSDGGLVNIFKNAGVIHCPWSINNKQINGDEKWSALNSTCTKISGWTANDLSTNGKWMKDMTLAYGYNPPAKKDNDAVELSVSPDKYINLPSTSTTLTASATTGTGIATLTWSQVSGPGTATLSSTNSATITVSNLDLGVYTFKVIATNGIDIQERTIEVTVLTQYYDLPIGGELIDDVTDNNITTLWGGTWDVFDDSRDLGASTITAQNNLPASGAIKAAYTLDKGAWQYNPYCGVEVSIQEDKTAFDLSDCQKITYKYKGSAHDFRAEMSVISDYDYHKKAVPVAANWTTVTINWSDLAQDPSWGVDVGAINKADIEMFSWQVSAASGSGTIEIDDLTCVGATGPVGGNMPPVVYAGTDINSTTTTASLDGSKSYDIEGAALSFVWSQLSGPSTTTIATPTASITDISNLQNVTYTFKLTANDGSLSNSDTVAVTVTQSSKTISLALKKGWNLVSINVIPDNANISTLFPNASLVKSSEGFYIANQPAYFNSINEIAAGVGYLVFNAKDENISITGSVATIQTTSLHAGWNMIGIPTQTNYPASSLPTQTIIVKDFDGFYEKNNNMSSISELNTGKAYFIKVSGVCEISW